MHWLVLTKWARQGGLCGGSRGLRDGFLIPGFCQLSGAYLWYRMLQGCRIVIDC